MVSRSSIEEKYRAMASTVCELQWLANSLQDLPIPLIQLALLYCDGVSAR